MGRMQMMQQGMVPGRPQMMGGPGMGPQSMNNMPIRAGGPSINMRMPMDPHGRMFGGQGRPSPYPNPALYMAQETPDSHGLQPGADGHESKWWRPVHEPGTLSQRAPGRWVPDGASSQYGRWTGPWFLWDAARHAWPAWHQWSRRHGRWPNGEHARGAVPCQLKQFEPSHGSATAWNATWRSRG